MGFVKINKNGSSYIYNKHHIVKIIIYEQKTGTNLPKHIMEIYTIERETPDVFVFSDKDNLENTLFSITNYLEKEVNYG